MLGARLNVRYNVAYQDMTKIVWHELSAREAMRELKSLAVGLSAHEARRRLEKFGPNALPRERSVRWWTILRRQFTSPLIVILIVAAAVSLALNDLMDTGVIVATVALNTVVGFAQEYKANRALEQLRVLVEPQATIRRDGREARLRADEVVPGDVVLLQFGDSVVADARLIESADLEVNEAPLTGESMPVGKQVTQLPAGAVLAERANMIYAGTSVVAGRGLAVVVDTGARTELGRIASLLAGTKEEATPLQAELASVARWISIAVILLIALLFGVGILQGQLFFEMLQTSIALAVAAVPEGLAVSVTVVLAIGMQRILRRKALVRRLLAAETLGSVSVICADKTGTITEGEMKVRQVVLAGEPSAFAALRETSQVHDMTVLLEAAVLCNDATFTRGTELTQPEWHGSPTERALLEAGVQSGLSADTLRVKFSRLAEIPFDSSRKFMATLHTWGAGRMFLLKGAPERVLERCANVLESGSVKPLSPERSRQWQHTISELTEQGLRVIAFAHKPVRKDIQQIAESDITDFTLVGLLALQDPLRQAAKEQIKRAREAGVRTVIITGDHPKTARAIAEEVGLSTHGGGVLTGEELDQWSDDELKRRVVEIDVYARVEPRHKIRIVDAWQARGEVVAMTGDGVNDAPALKSADVGVALGSGTEVAKEASDLVLVDNNLGTITAAIEEGRVIFDNIRKTIAYLMTDSLTAIILIAGSLILGLPLPLLPAQILWINLVTDSLPNIGLTMEPGEADIMRRPPRRRGEPVLNREMIVLIFLIGIVTDLVLFIVYIWILGATLDDNYARTMMFAAVGIDTLIYVFALKSFRRSVFRMNPFSNPWLLLGVAAGFALMGIALIVPFFQRVFEVTPLSLSDAGFLLIIGMIKLVAIECTKEALYLRRSRSAPSSL